MRKYVIGIFIGFCLSFAVGAHAEVSSFVGRVVEGMFPVTYNAAPLGDALVLDGTTYLPVRKLGEALGLTVSFDADLGVNLTKNTVGDSVYSNNTEQPAENPKYQKIRELDVQKKLLQKQTIEFSSIIHPYETIRCLTVETCGMKEKDNLYYDTVKTREESIAKIKEIEQEIKELADLERQRAALQP